MQPRGGPGASRLGKVTAFDEARGLGTVTGDDGVHYPFHCTAIADGTRHIGEGARVSFSVYAGHLGRMEARGITIVTWSAQSTGSLR